MSPAGPATAAIEPPLARDVVAQQLHALSRLVELGMEIAEETARQAKAPPEDSARPATDRGLTYARVARAVRLTIALQSRVLKDLAELDRAASVVRSVRIKKRCERIHDLVEEAIEAEHDDGFEFERLSQVAWERLTEDDDFADILDRPIAEVAAVICRELGVPLDLAFSPPGEKVSAEPTDEGAGPPHGVHPDEAAFPPSSDRCAGTFSPEGRREIGAAPA